MISFLVLRWRMGILFTEVSGSSSYENAQIAFPSCEMKKTKNCNLEVLSCNFFDNFFSQLNN